MKKKHQQFGFYLTLEYNYTYIFSAIINCAEKRYHHHTFKLFLFLFLFSIVFFRKDKDKSRNFASRKTYNFFLNSLSVMYLYFALILMLNYLKNSNILCYTYAIYSKILEL